MPQQPHSLLWILKQVKTQISSVLETLRLLSLLMLVWWALGLSLKVQSSYWGTWQSVLHPLMSAWLGQRLTRRLIVFCWRSELRQGQHKFMWPHYQDMWGKLKLRVCPPLHNMILHYTGWWKERDLYLSKLLLRQVHGANISFCKLSSQPIIVTCSEYFSMAAWSFIFPTDGWCFILTENPLSSHNFIP